MKTRRDFLQLSATGAAALALPRALSAAPAAATGAGRQPDKQAPRLLILGGTGFIGPHIVEAARARGFTVTLFNRGKTNPQLFPDIEKLHGDRKAGPEGLAALAGRRFDAVVDTSGYFPKVVRASAELLSKNVGRYVFISSVSVYGDPSKPLDESSPVGRIKNKTAEEIDKLEKIEEDTYGPLKALCEEAVERALPGRALNIRPGYIVGPRDPTDRFTYWPLRVARGGEVLTPGTPEDPIQIIDGRDLAAWIVRLLERGTIGVYNAVGPAQPLTMSAMLKTCKEVAGSDARFTYLEDAALERHKISEEELPIWTSPRGAFGGMHRTSPRRAIEKGLTYRPLSATVKDTLSYFQGLPKERQEKLRGGLRPDKEASVLAAWHAARGPGAAAGKPGKAG